MNSQNLLCIFKKTKKLDPYQEHILMWLKEYPDVTSAQRYDWLQEKLDVTSVAEFIYPILRFKYVKWIDRPLVLLT